MKLYNDFHKKILFAFGAVFLLFACSRKNLNYIVYYNKINEADSIRRIANQPEKAIKNYKKTFRKYPPKNQERFEEYETYIKLSDKFDKNFGGKKSLYKLIPLIANRWEYKKNEKDFMNLYKKYGIDSLEMEKRVNDWNKNLDPQLLDSMSILAYRDQFNGRKKNDDTIKVFDKKNAELLIWIFKKYGFPSTQKTGFYDRNHKNLVPIGAVFSHLSYTEYFPFFENKLIEYVKSGDCPPSVYAVMVDRNAYTNKQPTKFGIYLSYFDEFDTIKINSARKSIGLPTFKNKKIKSNR